MGKMDLLTINNISSGYGGMEVLHGVSLELFADEIVALIGPNGSGKSTVLKTIFGIVPVWSGEVLFDEVSIVGRRASENVREGISYVPQGSRVFTEMTVEENLEMGGYILEKQELVQEGLERVFALFPKLAERRHQVAKHLSGGEKQMLSLARALMVEPKMLLLDEPSLGLSPGLARKALDRIRQAQELLGMAVLIVEQNVREVLRISSRIYGLRNGRIVIAEQTDELDTERLRETFLHTGPSGSDGGA